MRPPVCKLSLPKKSLKLRLTPVPERRCSQVKDSCPGKMAGMVIRVCGLSIGMYPVCKNGRLTKSRTFFALPGADRLNRHGGGRDLFLQCLTESAMLVFSKRAILSARGVCVTYVRL